MSDSESRGTSLQDTHLGRNFTVMTDHQALEWMNRMNADYPRLTRWSLSLQSYRFTVKYRPWRMHGNVDALSGLERDNLMTAS